MLRAVRHDAFWQAHRFVPRDGVESLGDAPIERVRAGQRVQVAVAGRPAGYVAICGTHVKELYVGVAYQRQGMGAALLDWARHTMDAPLTLAVFAENESARRFYRSQGGRVVGWRSSPYPGHDQLLFSFPCLGNGT